MAHQHSEFLKMRFMIKYPVIEMKQKAKILIANKKKDRRKGLT